MKPELKGKVLLPILGDQYGLVLERGELHLGFEDGALSLQYFDNRLPVNPQAVGDGLRARPRAADRRPSGKSTPTCANS